ncbi:MAG: ABC transporter permease [Chitinophagales bacterium]
MFQFVIKRMGFIALSLLVISGVTFWLMHLTPGNFLELNVIMRPDQLGGDVTAIRQIQSAFDERYGLDKPLWRQYVTFVVNAVRFKFGPSFKYPTTNIEDLIAKGFPVSAEVALLATLVALIVGLPLGIYAALRQNTWIDYLITFISMLGVVIPNYVVAVFLLLIFSLWLRVLPTFGWGHWYNWIMPVLALSLAPLTSVVRYIRTSLVETLKQDYIRTAWAKGGSEKAVILGHALRNSLIPLVTVLGPQLGYLMIFSVLVERFFGVPGLGSFFADAALERDYPMLVTSVTFFAFVVMMMNLLVDVIYGFLDPRVRHGK